MPSRAAFAREASLSSDDAQRSRAPQLAELDRRQSVPPERRTRERLPD